MWPPHEAPRPLLLLWISAALASACTGEERLAEDAAAEDPPRLDRAAPATLSQELLSSVEDAVNVRKKYGTDSGLAESPLVHQNVRFYVHKKRQGGSETDLGAPDLIQEREALASACLQALERLLNYFVENTDQLIADGFLGVAIAQGQLQVALKEAPRPFLPLLTALEATCSRILQAVQPMIDAGLKMQVKGLQTMLRPEFWSGSRERGPLGSGAHPPWPLPLVSGTPDEDTSDHCLGLMLSSPECQISDECWLAETQDRALGYSLTHRLIFLQTARHSGCGAAVEARADAGLEQLIAGTCSGMLGEARTIADHDFPERLRDLLLEQMALCGAEGFAEFADPDWVDQVLQWQQSSGCYGIWDRFRRTKRSEQQMRGGCLVHYSAVAAGALATSARLLLRPAPSSSR